MSANAYEKLRVWHESIALARMIYDITATFPKTETFGLAIQMQRAAVSVASNIAEGAARNYKKEFHQFIGIALGSLGELHTQAIIAHGKYLNTATLDALTQKIESIRKMLSGLKTTLKMNG